VFVVVSAEVARRSLVIAASLCIYTNDQIMVETLATDTAAAGDVPAETPPTETAAAEEPA